MGRIKKTIFFLTTAMVPLRNLSGSRKPLSQISDTDWGALGAFSIRRLSLPFLRLEIIPW